MIVLLFKFIVQFYYIHTVTSELLSGSLSLCSYLNARCQVANTNIGYDLISYLSTSFNFYVSG